jgi:hypothetical protein
MDDSIKILAFLFFFVVFSAFRDFATDDKIKEYFEKSSYSHTLIDWSLKYSSITSTFISGFLTILVVFIPVNRKEFINLFLSFIL